MPSIFSSETTISLFAAVAPPHKPVLPPEITSFSSSKSANLTIFFKSSSLLGKTIAVGSGLISLYQSIPYFSKYS